jgi:radical SAM superfamily enzyme YgiQ (UPF0313 family)
MKIKIIEPCGFNSRYDQKSLTPNPGPVVIASLLEQAGHQVEVLSEYVTSFDIEGLNRADLVGISITTYNAPRGFEIAQQVKKPVVFGGFHASLMPEECLKYGEYVIRGDGYSVIDLADFLGNKKDIPINRIPNLVYKEKDKIVYNQSESKSVKIVPNYNLLQDYFKFNIRRLVRVPLLINASRGCNFDCTFCSIKAVYPDFKKKDVEVVIEDIKSRIREQHFLSKIFPRIIWITDDNFFSDKKWAKEVLRGIAKLKSGFCFTLQARVDIVHDDDLLVRMVDADVNRVYLGIESLNQESLDSFKKSATFDEAKFTVKKLRKYGIDVHGLFVFGDDNFQKGDGQKVAEFAKQYGLSGILIQPLTPYPGTILFKRLEADNRILHHNWEDYNGKVVFRPKNMSAAELQKEIYDCYSKVFSPGRVIRFFFSGNKGWKLEFLGEAIFRYLEKIKMEKYINNKLIYYSYGNKESQSVLAMESKI